MLEKLHFTSWTCLIKVSDKWRWRLHLIFTPQPKKAAEVLLLPGRWVPAFNFVNMIIAEKCERTRNTSSKIDGAIWISTTFDLKVKVKVKFSENPLNEITW